MEAMRNDLIIKERQGKAIKIKSKQKNFKKQMGLVQFRMRLIALCCNRDLEGMVHYSIILITNNVKGNIKWA